MARKRPLSPHLTIYKPIPTMVASIMHRITGCALYFGAILVVWWLLSASGADGGAGLAFINSWFGLLILFGYTLVLTFHMLGGIRHFIWDVGAMFEKQVTTKLAYATAAGAIGLTLLIWLLGLIG